MFRQFVFAAVVSLSVVSFAELAIVAPAEGEIVSQLRPVQAAFVKMSKPERDIYFDGAKNATALRADKSTPKPVLLKWTGDAASYTVTLKRLPDGKTFYSASVPSNSVEVDSLEIARSWELAVSDGKTIAKRTFRTEDQAPRLIRIEGVSNARDIGGRLGLDGRRLKQGLVFRTSGLNNNAPQDFYSNDEIMKFFKEGKLKKMGHAGRALNKKLKEGGKLHKTPKHNGLVKRENFAPGTKRLTEEERLRVLKDYGFKSDIDLRTDRECYGMTGSPLGPEAAWFHYSYAGYSILSPSGTNCNQKVFRVFLDPRNYPIVFHCIGGADRTGTVGVLLEALLGVDENNLWLDYLTTGFVGVVSDQRHKELISRVFNDLAKQPGSTWAERAAAYYRGLGFTQKEIDDFRAFMLEP